MTKFTRLGAAALGAVAAFSFLLAGPAMAKHRKHVVRYAPQVHAVVCDPRDPGNPFSKAYDYMTWSAWRRRGSWDTRAEWTCQPIPAYVR